MIRFQRPQLPAVAAIAAYYQRAEDARWYSNFGPCHAQLVERLEQRLGGGLHAVPVANCTLGISLALVAATGLAPGDRETAGREVIVPSYTFAATATAIVWAGLTPVFVDVDPGHWSMDPAALEQALQERGDRVAAVMACTTFGSPPPVAVSQAWERLAADAGVPLLIDSAAGFGALDAAGRAAGHLGDVEIFSWHATKPFAIGEGGLLCTADAALAERLNRLANFGFEDGVVTGAPGMNAKLAEWPAATALAVLDDFDDVLEARRDAATRLRTALAGTGLTFQELDSQPAWQFLAALAPAGTSRDDIVAVTAEHGVEVRSYFAHPLHRMPAFADAPRIGSLPVTEDLAIRALSLPMANDLTDAEHEAIVSAVHRSLASVGAR
ncbi:MAG: aminotransferase class I/II-fold pyridoxal phosphate-dependent enzyme [Solirubrobacteraceae bacterium]|nr:aminotransferase class I/II-fold pyridoxal phosphate-dependent enzyme [Solirubrobacteraceae bacterium]